MHLIVRLGPDDQDPFLLLIITTRYPKNGGAHLVVNFLAEDMSWSDPVGAALCDAQQAEQPHDASSVLKAEIGE